MVMEETRIKSIDDLVKEINDAYGKRIITVEDTHIGFMVTLGENPVDRIWSIYKLKSYLVGMKHGIELMKEGI